MKDWVGLAFLICLMVVSAAAQERAKAPATGRQSSVARADSRQQSEKPQPASQDPIYVIGPDDILDISVWKEPDFSLRLPVRPDGKISLPLLNDVQAAGLTPMQLAASVAVMLRKYLTQPQVTVIVTQMNSRRVYMIGEVMRPGPIPMLPNMTVLQALATAGGPSQFANQKGIYVLRTEDGKQVKYPFNYKEAIKGKAPMQDIALKPGDTIVIP